ncbi:MAG TPA: 3-dehydroquinate synthase family protein [Jatrophihabitans sp.]|jgi:3-dehydroquinate synthase
MSSSTDTTAPLRIASRQWDYDVLFASTIAEAEPLAADGYANLLVICDSNVAELHREALTPLLQKNPSYIVDPTEETKSLAGSELLVNWLIEQGATRSTTLLAVGGGTIQDVVSFVAHIYFRGIDWVFLPTTVLSQADSCIGAKSSINVLPYKNQLGSLHSPKRIVITTEFLSTLPDVEIESGYGEIVKLSVISSRYFIDQLESALADGGVRNNQLLALTRASLFAKQEIIEIDEYEEDLRRILNYGHSFGHALEAVAKHQVPHGLGVLWGIGIVNWLGVKWGITDPLAAARLDLLIRANFDYRLPIVPTADDLLTMLARDKKVRNGSMYFAVLVKEGELVIEPKAIDADLKALVEEYLATDYLFK